MRNFLRATLLAGIAAAIPCSLMAEPPHPGGGHPAALHPPAVVHAPVSHVHVAPHATYHHTVGHPVSAYHHHVVRHIVHHHPVAVHVTHHVAVVGHGRTHLSPRVAALRRNITAARHFHAGIYRAPPGYHYQRWGYGQFLPAVYWGRDFWITDFLAFGLFAPPDGLIWVRYGPDALLVDQYTGEIIQVDYGVFY